MLEFGADRGQGQMEAPAEAGEIFSQLAKGPLEYFSGFGCIGRRGGGAEKDPGQSLAFGRQTQRAHRAGPIKSQAPLFTSGQGSYPPTWRVWGRCGGDSR